MLNSLYTKVINISIQENASENTSIDDVLPGYFLSNSNYWITHYITLILDNEKVNATGIKDMTKSTTPFYFEGKLKRCCYKIGK